MNRSITGFVSVSCLILLSAQTHAAYIPPLGVPPPPFGIEETVESVYGSSTFYTYYIDNTHPNATDSNNPNGTPAQPRETIPDTLVAGDVVQVHGGPYTTSRDRFGFDAAGTAAQPIIITGANAATKPVLQKFVELQSGQYVIFEHFKVSTTKYGLKVNPETGTTMNHVSIRNVEMAGSGEFKSRQQFSVGDSSDVVFYNNLSYDAGMWNSEAEDDTHAFNVGGNSHRIWVLDNTAYRSGGDGIQVGHNANFTIDHVYIGRNTFYQHRENGIDIKEANDVIMTQNTMYNFKDTDSSSGAALVVHYDPARIWVMFNRIYDCDIGIITTGSTDTHFIGNLVYNVRHSNSSYNPSSAYSFGAALHVRGSDDVHIVHNTIHDYDTGIQVANGGDVHMHRNIFSQRGEPNAFEVLVGTSANENTCTLDQNLFGPQTSGTRIGWGSSSPTPVTALQQQTPVACNGCLDNTDPKFVNTTIRNFQLQDDSPAKDLLPAAYPSYGRYFTLYGVNISKDLAGSARPLGTGWDLGAYEINGSAPGGTAPKPPTNLRIIQTP